MARTHHQQQLYALKQTDERLTALFMRLADDIRALLLREELPSGIVPRTRSVPIREAVGRLVTRLFLSPSNGELVSFTVTGGRVIPLSPYMTALWQGVEEATRIAVEQHAFYMRRALTNAPDVLLALQNATESPFAAARRVAEFDGFTPQPFLSYDPLHRFVDPSGYTLSLRIWRVAGDTRRKLDAFLAESIAEGRGARSIAVELETFLHPSRVLKRTNKPYGTNASYDAMRLARTEITAAAGRSGLLAAHLNPFVEGVDWVRSASRSPCSSGICDVLEAGSPYTLDNVPNLPGDSHPQCMCHYRWRLVDNPKAIITQLQSQMRAGRGERVFTRLIGPLMIERFVRLLLDDPDEVAA